MGYLAKKQCQSFGSKNKKTAFPVVFLSPCNALGQHVAPASSQRYLYFCLLNQICDQVLDFKKKNAIAYVSFIRDSVWNYVL